MIYRILLFLLLACCADAGLLIGNPRIITTPDKTYAQTMQSVITPWFEKGHQGTFTGTEGVPIRYGVFRAAEPTGAVILLTGYSQNIDLLREVIYDLNRGGLHVYAYDHRGHGGSGRILQDTEKVWVCRFTNYVDDLDLFISTIVQPDYDGPLYGLAHSMGGLVLASYLSSRPDHPLQAAVLSAPMLEINTGDISKSTAWLLANTVGRIPWLNRNYAPGVGPFNPDSTFTENASHNNRPRWEWEQQWRRDNPAKRNGGATFGWVKEALNHSNKLRKSHAAERIGIPVLILQAENDAYVSPAGQNEFCNTARDCRLVSFTGYTPAAGHEIYNEGDHVRQAWLDEVLNFIGSHP